ncbi:MAG: glycosyltransferase, partial [Verrucomicrobiae bacterium]|nr:glycosyltransferase [Verrucomicrobiae bacterium]
MSDEKPVLSVVVAAYNEGENLPVLCERVSRIDWGSIGVCLELVFVDDHSSDGTYAVLRRLASM